MVAIGAATIFFVAGSAGMLRFPDVFMRLHAMTKADNLGLGLLIVGLALQASSFWVIAKLVLIWLLVLVSSTSASHLVARDALARGLRPWRNP
ncbi:MAG: monovalent cation/H(+) antiporter subunit G [Bradymonadaceae bacterium]|nr:monovalent cation/H(+) antiporter subunit G [Lujinxingiaceae bacterium]